MDHRLSTDSGIAASSTAPAIHPALADISLVVFDLDGTLIDSAPDLARAVDKTLIERDLAGAGLDKVRHWVGNGSYELIERALTDALSKPPSGAMLDAAHARFLAVYAAAPCERTRLYEGARAGLESLRQRGIVCALVTNKPIDFLPPILARFDLAPFFALTLGGDSLKEKKPHPAPLLHVADKTGVAPARALMVGDSRHDMQAGKAAGFRTLAVTYGYNHGEPIADSQPDYVVDSLARLADGPISTTAGRI